MQLIQRAMGVGDAVPGPVTSGLNLTLELREPLEMPVLLAGIKFMLPETHQALKELHFVHFARFLPVRGNTALLVITEFDGPLQAYVMDFVIAIGDAFSFILKFVKDAPPLPVKDHPREFLEFVKANNRVVVLPPLLQWDSYPLYSAYPDRTVIDIIGPRTDLPPPVFEPAAAQIDLDDVQGNILRGFHADIARHFALRIDSAAATRAFLSVLVDGAGADCPLVTTARNWDAGQRPSYFLNIGVTAEGLEALGVPDTTLRTFPVAFVDGPSEPSRAVANGDTGASAPQLWELGTPGQPVHLLVSLYGDIDQRAEFDRRSEQLARWWTRGGLRLLVAHDANALPDDHVHFGYRDGIAQPRIAGGSTDGGSDMQPSASAGEFLLGTDYDNVYGGRSLGSLPGALCQNATFAAVRVLDQDVAAFEQLLDDASAANGIDRELIAAKLMGRWRDGTPLARSPSVPAGATAGAARSDTDNAFDYAPSHEHPLTGNDHAGLRCPVGAHIRRMNPRSALVAGSPHSRRLIRRGMPYGPAWGEGREPTARRGLYGIFICADLERQFEFMLQAWANGDTAASGIRGTRDPIVGAQPAGGGDFRFPVSGGAAIITLTVPRLVTTRGSLYLLMPGLGGLRHLASLNGGLESATPAAAPPLGATPWLPATPQVRRAASFDPDAFDPKDPAFLDDPFPYYAIFRERAPVALVRHGTYASHWVFSHELVTEVCNDTARFLKRPKDETGDRGLFFMDPPRHDEVRNILDPLFGKAIANSAAMAEQLADEAIAAIRAQGSTFDLIPAYANRVTRNVFMSMFGIPTDEWDRIGALVDTVLKHFDQMLPVLQRAPAAVASAALLGYFWLRHFGCPAHPTSTALLNLMNSDGRSAGLHEREVTQTALHFALGGYLSTEFLIGTGIHNLLSHPGAMAAYRSANPADRARTIEEMKRFDAPFQMADRYAAEDTLLGGCKIPAGAMVTVVYGSANRDEVVFGSDADAFRPDRIIPQGLNYVFGHGIHHCIGAPMVAEVAPVVFDKLIGAMPGLALAGSPSRRIPDPYYRAFAGLALNG